VQEQLHEEVAGVLRGAEPTAEDVARLPLTKAVIDETMRLYPPAWMLGRSARGDDTLANSRERGQFVLVSRT